MLQPFVCQHSAIIFLSTCCNHLLVNTLQSFVCQHAANICLSTCCNHLFVNILQSFFCQHAANICLSTCCNHLFVNMLQSFVCQYAALRYFSWRFSEARLDLGKYVCRDRSLPAFIVKRLKIPKRKIVPLALTWWNVEMIFHLSTSEEQGHD